MRLSTYLSSLVLLGGCSVYDEALLGEAIGEDDSADLGDGDGDGDSQVGDGDGGSGDGDGDPAESGGAGSGGAATGGTGSGGTDTGGSGSGGNGSGGMGSGGNGSGGIPIGIESMVDDFTAPAAYINSIDGRFGPWAVYTDGTAGVMVPGPGQPFSTEAREDDALNQALHVTATGFTSWGAGIFVSLNNVSGPLAYDLQSRSYDAIRLWAKLGSETAHSDLRINLADTHSTTAGTCAEPCAQDHLRAQLFLDTEWTEYTILLSDFNRQVLPTPAEWSAVYELHFNMDAEDIDFWLDDIRFVDLP